MARRNARVHLLLCMPDRDHVDTYCARREPLHYLAVITDPDGVNCKQCRKKYNESRRNLRMKERRIRRELGARINGDRDNA